nr:hypothetical protein [Candidatus Neomarinimicrobiota bacterium]
NSKWSTNMPSNHLEQCKQVLSSVQGFSIDTYPVYQYLRLSLFDSYKSISWTFEENKVYWIKIKMNPTSNLDYVMKVKAIYGFSYSNDTDSDDTDSDDALFETHSPNKCIPLAYGEIYPLLMPETQDISNKESYMDMIPHIDKSSAINLCWFQIGDDSVVETVLLTHKHVLDEDCDTFKRDWIQSMAEYVTSGGLDPLAPCGPVLSCSTHAVVKCRCSAGKKQMIWFCNSDQETIYYVWGADQGWLPGLLEQIQRKNETVFQAKPPVV